MKKKDELNIKKKIKDCYKSIENISEAINIYENYDDKYDWLPIPTSMGFVSVRVPKSFIIRDLKRQKKESEVIVETIEDCINAHP